MKSLDFNNRLHVIVLHVSNGSRSCFLFPAHKTDRTPVVRGGVQNTLVLALTRQRRARSTVAWVHNHYSLWSDFSAEYEYADPSVNSAVEQKSNGVTVCVMSTIARQDLILRIIALSRVADQMVVRR